METLHSGLLRPAGYKKYPIEQVHELFRKWQTLGSTAARRKQHVTDTFDGYPVKAWSQRYDLFLTNTKCVCCGLEANCYILEKSPEAKVYHFNLYHVDENGKETLFTKDHIIPVTKGGKNIATNYQTMCAPCNSRKGNRL